MCFQKHADESIKLQLPNVTLDWNPLAWEIGLGCVWGGGGKMNTFKVHSHEHIILGSNHQLIQLYNLYVFPCWC